MLLNSNGHILAIVAAGAAVIAAAMSIFLRRRRRSWPAVVVDPEDRNESTGELPVLVGSGVN